LKSNYVIFRVIVRLEFIFFFCKNYVMIQWFEKIVRILRPWDPHNLLALFSKRWNIRNYYLSNVRKRVIGGKLSLVRRGDRGTIFLYLRMVMTQLRMLGLWEGRAERAVRSAYMVF
jgi:hypothetical protein